jgi:hypothetical protein
MYLPAYLFTISSKCSLSHLSLPLSLFSIGIFFILFASFYNYTAPQNKSQAKIAGIVVVLVLLPFLGGCAAGASSPAWLAALLGDSPLALFAAPLAMCGVQGAGAQEAKMKKFRTWAKESLGQIQALKAIWEKLKVTPVESRKQLLEEFKIYYTVLKS